MMGSDPVIQRPRIKRASRYIDPHFKTIQKLGYPDGLRCWCGSELTFEQSKIDQVASRLRMTRKFMEEHEECLPKKEGKA